MLRIIASTLLLLTFSITSNSAVSLAATQGAIAYLSESQFPEYVKQNDAQKTCKDDHGNIFCSE